MRRLAALALALLACRAPAPARPGPAAGAPPRMQLVLLAGQSNMAGRGAVEPADRVPHPRVWMLDSTDRWVPAVDPVHFDKPAIVGVGPGRAFAAALVAGDSTLVVGLVPTAVGGSAIEAWAPGGYDAATRTQPYDEALRRARLAAARGHFVAVLWHQGESDADERRAPLYEARLRAVIARVRADLGEPALPFLIGGLGRFPERPWSRWHAAVDSAQRRLVATVPNTAYVPSEGLGHRGDTLHFSRAAAQELGRRYAAAYLAMTRR